MKKKLKVFKSSEKRRQVIMIIFTLLVGFTFLIGIVLVPLSYNNSESESQITPEKLVEKFSNNWIFEEELTDIEKQFLIERRITIVSYYYTSSSSAFELESTINTLNGQAILEKIKSNQTMIELNSIQNYVMVKEINQDKIFEGLCQTLIYPPPDCAIFAE